MMSPFLLDNPATAALFPKDVIRRAKEASPAQQAALPTASLLETWWLNILGGGHSAGQELTHSPAVCCIVTLSRC